MIKWGAVLAGAAVACTALACAGVHRQNRLISTPIGLMKLRAAHEPVYVDAGDGTWRRVWIDTGASDDWAPAGTVATSADGTVRVIERDAQYIIYDGERGARVLAAVPYATSHTDRTMSPDGRWFAFADRAGSSTDERPYEIVLVSTVDLAVKRIASESTSIRLAWLDDALWFETLARWRRIDPATGAVSDPLHIPTALGIGDEDCPAVGLRLHLADLSGRREIVAIPIASTANPEQLATAHSRVLVAAETGKTRWPHGGPVPHHLTPGVFTPSCKYFAFEFGGTIYVGDVADGRFARLTEGADVAREPPGQ